MPRIFRPILLVILLCVLPLTTFAQLLLMDLGAAGAARDALTSNSLKGAALIGTGDPGFSQSMSKEEAYRLLKKSYTPFNPRKSGISKAEREYLSKVFNLMDMAVVERVLIHKNKVKDAQNFTKLTGALHDLTPPVTLYTFRDSVSQAFSAQYDYLRKNMRQKLDKSHVKVRSASRHLKQALNQLEQNYPYENAANKQAFSMHIEVLDFL